MFLFDVYASSRADELAPVPWTQEQKWAFLAQQFHAQDTDYHGRYPDADFSVIERDGVPAGRLYVARVGSGGINIVDIGLLPEHRGAGIGTALVSDIIATADREGVIVSLHVEQWNPARRLYRRLGFVEVTSNEVYIRMERRPDIVS